MTALRFSLADMEQAHDTWGANCGPGALAAVCGLTLSEVRPHMGDFESKHYTNPTLMFAALNSVGVNWRKRKSLTWPDHGLARIQWEGPWTSPGVPMRARYRYTHWVGSWYSASNGIGIFDINALNSGGMDRARRLGACRRSLHLARVPSARGRQVAHHPGYRRAAEMTRPAIIRTAQISEGAVFIHAGRPLKVVRVTGDDKSAPVICEELSSWGEFCLAGQLALWSVEGVLRALAPKKVVRR